MGNLSKEQYALLTDYDTNTAYSKAFHTLFANIRFNWGQDANKTHVHTLLLTTPSEYAEQPVVAANLAIVAAQSGTATILVDADLHSPSLQQSFGLDRNTGLSDLLLEEEMTPERVVDCLQSTFIPGFRVLSAGTKTAQGPTLLLSPKLEKCMCSIRQVLDASETKPGIVNYHSPPALAGVELTIIAGRTTREQAKQAQEQLQRAHTNLAGIIMLNP